MHSVPTGQRIAERRAAAKLTQREAAALVGVTLNGWQHYEYEVRAIPPPTWRLFWILTDPKPGLAARRLLKQHRRKS
jgi:transcriptional regulator with XRE-family HTH domain